MKRSFLIFLCISLLLISGCTEKEDDYTLAKRYFRAGDFEKSQRLIEKYIEKVPEYEPEALFFLAVSYSKNSEYEKALDMYDRILSDEYISGFSENSEFIDRLEEDRRRLILEYAYYEGEKGRIDKAQELINRVVTEPHDFQFHMGMISLNRKEYTNAQAHFRNAFQMKGKEDLKTDINFMVKLHFYQSVLFYELYKATGKRDDIMQSFREMRLARILSLSVGVSQESRRKVSEFYDTIRQEKVYKDIYEHIDRRMDLLRIYERGQEWEKIAEAADYIIEKSEIKDDRMYAATKAGDAAYELKRKEEALKYYRIALENARAIEDIIAMDLEERISQRLRELGYDIGEN